MLPQQLVIGRAYYRLTYADPQRTIPSVHAMIYVGVDIFDSEAPASHPVYTFQDTMSYMHGGSVVERRGPTGAGSPEPLAYSYGSAELAEVVELSGAVNALKESLARAQSVRS